MKRIRTHKHNGKNKQKPTDPHHHRSYLRTFAPDNINGIFSLSLSHEHDLNSISSEFISNSKAIKSFHIVQMISAAVAGIIFVELKILVFWQK